MFLKSLRLCLYAIVFYLPLHSCGQAPHPDMNFVRSHYTKIERMITMRDGVKLFTAIYVPIDSSQTYPFLMMRTPYSCAPYGDSSYPQRIGPNKSLMQDGYIFVYQDVRGRYKSEGQFQEMTPAHENDSTHHPDESTDAYDTIDWLLQHIKNNNGNVGIYGISYPGFYASASLPNAHPAIKAVSPQAPVTDEFIGDDANHNGAFFWMDNFSFLNDFDGTRNASGTDYETLFKIKTKDAYEYYLNIGTIKKANDSPYFNKRGPVWNEYLQHDTYDAYWKARNIRTHLKNIKPAVLVVGGWFDAEDLFGALRTYEAIEQQSPGNKNSLVMGPWTHGAWARGNWEKFGGLQFGQNTSQYFNDSIQTPFFNYYLKNKGGYTQSEALVFETGTNTWKQYKTWPPANASNTTYYLQAKGGLKTAVSTTSGFDSYVSDPKKPVPYIEGTFAQRNNEYMVADQRFASKREDVLTYQTETLVKSLTISGRLQADLFVSPTGTDADFVVKLIDVFPDTALINGKPAGGYQRLVRAEVFRGKFRNSFEKPAPFVAGKVAEIKFDLNDVAHAFLPGHRIMVQVQSSWFPLVDRNPQKFMRIPDADEKDFQKATIKLYHDATHPSHVVLPVLAD